ncbi:MAG: tetratricopeptide repeat protein [Armatimonadota bacterium]
MSGLNRTASLPPLGTLRACLPCLLLALVMLLAGCGARVAPVWLRPQPPQVRKRDYLVEIREREARQHPGSILHKIRLAQAYLEAGEPLLAREKFQEVLGLDEHNVEALVGMGDVASAAGDFAAAVAWHQRALEVAESSAAVRQSLGDVYLQANDPLRAAEEFRKAAEQAPEEVGPLLSISEAYRIAGRLEQAAAACRRAMALDPTDPRPHVNSGALFEVQGQYDRAEAAYRRAIELDPGEGTGQNNLAYLWAKRGVRLDEALELAQQAVAVATDATRGSFLDTLGTVLYAKGEPEAALEALTAAKRELPWSATIRYHLGLAYYATGYQEHAVTELRQSLALSPRGEHAAEAEALLRRLAPEAMGVEI